MFVHLICWGVVCRVVSLEYCVFQTKVWSVFKTDYVQNECLDYSYGNWCVADISVFHDFVLISDT